MMFGSADLVSVIIPFFNPNERFLREAIASVLAQSHQNWEIILVDDGSQDCAGDVAREYADRAKGAVRLVVSEHNRGLSGARNLGVRHANGAFLTFLDADDVYLRRKLELEVAALRRRPPAAMVCTNTRYWHEWSDSPSPSRDFVPSLGEPGLFDPPTLLERWVSCKSAVPASCSFMVSRDAFLAVGGFDERFTGLYEDQVFLAKVALRYPVLLVEDVTACYRQHDASMCARSSPEMLRHARQAFLRWVEEEAEALGTASPRLKTAIHTQRWLLEHPRVARALRALSKRLMVRANARGVAGATSSPMIESNGGVATAAVPRPISAVGRR